MLQVLDPLTTKSKHHVLVPLRHNDINFVCTNKISVVQLSIFKCKPFAHKDTFPYYAMILLWCSFRDS